MGAPLKAYRIEATPAAAGATLQTTGAGTAGFKVAVTGIYPNQIADLKTFLTVGLKTASGDAEAASTKDHRLVFGKISSELGATNLALLKQLLAFLSTADAATTDLNASWAAIDAALNPE